MPKRAFGPSETNASALNISSIGYQNDTRRAVRIQIMLGENGPAAWMELPTAKMAWGAVDELARITEETFGPRPGAEAVRRRPPPAPKHQTVRSGVKFIGLPVANPVSDDEKPWTQSIVRHHLANCTTIRCIDNDERCPILHGTPKTITDIPTWPYTGHPYHGYLGPIEIGMIFDWEPGKPHDYERVLVVGVDGDPAKDERAIYTIRPDWPETTSRKMIDNLLPRSKWNNPRVWNDEGRFREAVRYVGQTRLA